MLKIIRQAGRPRGRRRRLRPAGPVVFGDPDARFADLVAIIVDAAGRLRAGAGEVI